MIQLSTSEIINDMLSHSDTIPEYNRQIDRQTTYDSIAHAIFNMEVSICTCQQSTHLEYLYTGRQQLPERVSSRTRRLLRCSQCERLKLELEVE